jgi:outer membrane PBP1 activator LpoA protein
MTDTRVSYQKYIPPSCVALDLHEAARVLIKLEGDIPAAAKKLRVLATDLRVLARLEPVLVEAQLEIEEQALDKAEQILFEALNAPDLPRRLEAAVTVLRNSAAGRRRGWGSP